MASRTASGSAQVPHQLLVENEGDIREVVVNIAGCLRPGHTPEPLGKSGQVRGGTCSSRVFQRDTCLGVSWGPSLLSGAVIKH